MRSFIYALVIAFPFACCPTYLFEPKNQGGLSLEVNYDSMGAFRDSSFDVTLIRDTMRSTSQITLWPSISRHGIIGLGTEPLDTILIKSRQGDYRDTVFAWSVQFLRERVGKKRCNDYAGKYFDAKCTYNGRNYANPDGFVKIRLQYP